MPVSRPSMQFDELLTSFGLVVQREPEVARVSPVGELDLATVDRLRTCLRELIADGVPRLVIDLRGTTFVDSTALHLLVSTHAESVDQGWRLEIIPGSPTVHRPIVVIGLDEQLPFVDPTAADGRS